MADNSQFLKKERKVKRKLLNMLKVVMLIIENLENKGKLAGKQVTHRDTIGINISLVFLCPSVSLDGITYELLCPS